MSLPTNPPAPQSKTKIKHSWWKESSVYQIYPASFKDSNGDGIGDIPGIISELDYIKNLGVDLVWLSPILKSPQVDMGYDISDYKDIDAQYGTMADHDAMIKGLHDRGMKYVMDLVVNHTSNEHEWFKSSRSSKDSPYRDWYIWKPARHDDQGKRIPPNNWESAFSGSAWEWDEPTQEYYLHIFATEQPDLNWENPKVVEAVHDIIRFWLKRGVDGFRMDVINFISKEPGLPDGKITKPGFLQSGVEHFACGPRLHEFLGQIGQILIDFNAFSVGEMPGVTDTKEILKAVGQDRHELAMVFQFEIVDMDHEGGSKWEPRPFSPKELKTIVNKWETFMLHNAGWNALYMENHDQSRTVTRYCSDLPEFRTKSAKMVSSFLGLQSGTVFVYQGQELSQKNVPASWPISKYKDIECINHWNTVLRDYPDDKEKQEMYKRQYRLIGRDNARTPIQWTPRGKSAGFSPEDAAKEPWMPIHEDFQEWNAETLVADKSSSYHHWNRVLNLRKSHSEVLVYGDFEMLDMDHEAIVAYIRTQEEITTTTETVKSSHGKKVLVISNFCGVGREGLAAIPPTTTSTEFSNSQKQKGIESDGSVWWTLPKSVVEVFFDENTTTFKKGAVVEELRNYKGDNEFRKGPEKKGEWQVKIRPYEGLVVLI